MNTRKKALEAEGGPLGVTPEDPIVSAPFVAEVATGAIEGRLLDELGEPQSGTVTVDGPVTGVLSPAEDGFFSFTDLPPGLYAVAASVSDSDLTCSRKKAKVEPGQTTIHDIYCTSREM